MLLKEYNALVGKYSQGDNLVGPGRAAEIINKDLEYALLQTRLQEAKYDVEEVGR
jgi:hypothetical protein